jgi:hypothetical protein
VLKISLRGRNRTGRANIGARTAVFALLGVDHVEAVDFANGAIGAFRFARGALNAIIFIDNVRHVPFLSKKLRKFLFDCLSA